MACTMKKPVPQTPFSLLQGSLHVDRAEDHILRRTERQFRHASRHRKGGCRTDKDGFCRSARTGDQEGAGTRIHQYSRKCAFRVLLPDHTSQWIMRGIQALSSEMRFTQIFLRSHLPRSSRPPLPRRDGGAYGARGQVG